jgi:hypothetical protein
MLVVVVVLIVMMVVVVLDGCDVIIGVGIKAGCLVFVIITHNETY